MITPRQYLQLHLNQIGAQPKPCKVSTSLTNDNARCLKY